MSMVIIPRPLAPARAAEIADQAATKIERLGLCQENTLFSPMRGTISVRGAVALSLGIPLLADYLFSPLRRNDPEVAEHFEFEKLFADFMHLPPEPECDCGSEHDNRMVRWEDTDEVTTEIAVGALRRFRDAYTTLAAHDATSDSFVDWDEFARQLSDGGAEG